MTDRRTRILLLEDDPNLGQVVQEHLHMNGYEVTLCVDGQAGAETAESETFDLCLIDVMLPKMDGFTFAEQFRQRRPDVPFIFLTARSLKEDRIRGFKTGCDDYITKPFSIEELLLRIEAVLKRVRRAGPGDDQAVFELGLYRFDYTHSVLIRGRKQQKLTPKEADLLRLLCRHMNRTLSRQTALQEIWGSDSYFSGRSMDVYISRLRKYLKADPSVEIMGIHGQGFRLVVDRGDR
jgi:DNA-binding response OmpR family regulator